MQKITQIIAIILTILVIPAFSRALAGENKWELVNDKDGIQSYSRRADGSKLLEIKAVMVVDAPIENVGEMIRDIPGYVNWMPYCGNGMVLSGNRDDADIRILLDLPWPVTDREVLLNARVSYDLDHGRAFIDMTNQADQYDVFEEGVIRVPVFKGRYTVEYVTRHKTGIIYQYSLDLAGTLPGPLKNSISKFFLYENLKNLREKVNSARYREMGRTSNDRRLCEAILENPDRLDEVVRARLEEFIRDKPFVDWLSEQVSLYDLITSEDGHLSEMLLYSGQAESARLEAVRYVVRKVMETRNATPEIIENLMRNEGLIRAIHSGDGEMDPYEVLTAQLEGRH